MSDTHQWLVSIGAGPVCSDYLTQADCLANGCYWCDGACQSTPCGTTPPDWQKYIPYAVLGLGVVAVAVVLLRRKPYAPPPGRHR